MTTPNNDWVTFPLWRKRLSRDKPYIWWTGKMWRAGYAGVLGPYGGVGAKSIRKLSANKWWKIVSDNA